MNDRIARVSLFHLATLILLTSCGDGQGLTDVTFDVSGTAQTLDVARNVVMSPALTAQLALAPRYNPPETAPAFAEHGLLVGQQIGVLPAEYMGTTFALEDAHGSYQPTEMLGAPENALRFLVYAINTSGDPVVQTAIGHADLTDEGVEMENGFAIGIVVSIDELVIADYTTSFDADGETAGLARVSAFDHVGLNIAGSLRTETGEILIDMVTGTVNSVVITEFALVSGDATFIGEVTEEEESGLRTFQAQFALGDDRLTVTANGLPSSFAAEIVVNDADWATVSVQPEAVTATGLQGPLNSTEESIALRMAEYFLIVPNLAVGLVPGVLISE